MLPRLKQLAPRAMGTRCRTERRPAPEAGANSGGGSGAASARHTRGALRVRSAQPAQAARVPTERGTRRPARQKRACVRGESAHRCLHLLGGSSRPKPGPYLGICTRR
jgi:hypothetical protein